MKRNTKDDEFEEFDEETVTKSPQNKNLGNLEEKKVNRAGFIEIIIQLCGSLCTSKKDKACDFLNEFISGYKKRIMPKTTLVSGRKKIRNSKELNQLLIDNSSLLQKTFDSLTFSHESSP